MGEWRYFSCLAQALRKNTLLKKDLCKIKLTLTEMTKPFQSERRKKGNVQFVQFAYEALIQSLKERNKCHL